MNLLLDTHVFLWFVNGDPRLPPTWRDDIRSLSNTVYLSVVSVWEAIIKYQHGKLPLPEPAAVYLPRLREQHRFTSLAVDEPTLKQLANLPPLHRDPFDRMLVAQALHHGLTLVTADATIRTYPVDLLDSA